MATLPSVRSEPGELRGKPADDQPELPGFRQLGAAAEDVVALPLEDLRREEHDLGPLGQRLRRIGGRPGRLFIFLIRRSLP